MGNVERYFSHLGEGIEKKGERKEPAWMAGYGYSNLFFVAKSKKKNLMFLRRVFRHIFSQTNQ